MIKKSIFSIGILTIVLNGCFSPEPIRDVDVCIYGGTAAGVIAAYSAKRMGKSVVLIEPSRYLGGLTTGGLGATDIGNKYAITGLSRDFYRRIGQHYGYFEGWTFAPSVATKILHQYVDEAQIDVIYQKRIISASKKGTKLLSMTLEDAQSPKTEPKVRIIAKQFIDCSYEGDLMALAGVTYAVGRESNAQYNETWNGVYLAEYRKNSGYHQFPDGVDPYQIPGDPKSGLLWGISADTLEPRGTGDNKVQAYNFRICLTNNSENIIPITKPANYDPKRYELLARAFEAQPDDWPISEYFIWSRMPGNKTDVNNRGAFSTDMIGANYDFPEASYDERERIFKAHEDYTKGLLYFYLTDPRVPKHLQDFVSQWGYPKDEYPDNDHWTPQLYIREARRMVGSYVMTEANCTGKAIVTDGIGMAAYTMDSHNCQRIVIYKDGRAMVKNEGNVEVGGFDPYPVSYRALLPKENECTNLLVPVCLSSSHIAFGSIRMEPVFMVLGQSAAVAACMAIDNNTSTHAVDVKLIQERLKKDPLLNGSIPELLIDDADTDQVESSGEWRLIKAGHYKTGFRYIAKASKGTFFRFSSNISHTGKYKVYYYCPFQANLELPETMTIAIQSTSGIHEVTFSPRLYAGSWAEIGVYTFNQGETTSIMVNGDKTTGPLFADAVILYPITYANN